MSVSTQCPTCGHQIKGDERYAGKTAHCPACHEVIRFPESIIVVPAIDTRRRPQSPAAVGQAVRIVAVDMPFYDMVALSLKWVAASLVAGILLAIPFWLLVGLFALLASGVTR